MIIDQTIEIKISKKNIYHYSIYFPNIKLKDVISIDIEKHLQKNSNIVINVKCDICYINRSIKYQAYTKNINSCPEYPIYTCDKCSHVKLKSTNIKKYGVEYYSKTQEYSEKFKSTMIRKYGVEHALQNEKFKNKAKETNLEKFGVENPFQSEEIKEKIKNVLKSKYGYSSIQLVPEIREKIKQTNIRNHGVEYPFQSKDIRKKSTITNLEKYGHNLYSKTNEYLEKAKKSNLINWGYEWTLQSPEIKNSIYKTNLEKYGTDNPMKSEMVRSDLIISNDPHYIKYLSNSISLFFCEIGHEFEMNIDIYHSRRKNGIDLCTVCNPIGDSRSIKENDLHEFIKSIYNGEVIQSYKDGLEIDVYLPELKLGFEFNGLYWHSEKYKEKKYHSDKTNYFKDRGIRIVHIWEDDWDNKKEIIKSQIRNWIDLTDNKIYARKCFVKEIPSPESKSFLDQNHIQGNVRSCLRLGLYHKDELVSIMVFDHFEGRKKMPSTEWNLSRFCNVLNTNVIGGASKLLSYFIKNYNPKRIISYADKDWSMGGVYYKLNFSLIGESDPDYKYIIDNNRVHKSKFRKSKLNTNLSESNYMREQGIYRIWDCGKIKFEIKYINNDPKI